MNKRVRASSFLRAALAATCALGGASCLFDLPGVLPAPADSTGDGGGGPPTTATDGPVGIPFSRQSVITVVEASAPAGVERAFTVAVVLDDSRIEYASAAADGSDVRFLDDAGEVLPHEWDIFDPTGRSIAWVQLPRLDGGSTFRMVYGGESPPEAAPASAAWSQYDFVYHFLPEANSTTTVESSPNALMGELVELGGRVATAGTDDPAALGTALRFSERDPLPADGQPHIDFGRPAAVSLQQGEVLTVETWYSWTEFANFNGGMIAWKEENCEGWAIFIASSEADNSALLWQRWGFPETNCSADELYADNSHSIIDSHHDDAWHHLVTTFGPNDLVMYLDGTEVRREGGVATDPGTTSGDFLIGTSISRDESFGGLIGEMRVLHQTYSPAEVSAHYLAMRDELLSYGPVEVVAPPTQP